MPGLVANDNGYITYESSAGPEYGDGSRHCLARAVNKHCTPSLCEEVRQKSDSVWEVGGGGHNMEKEAWQHVFALLISTNKCRKSHSSYLNSNACELEVAICCLWCILYFNTNLPLFLLVLMCCSMHVNDLWLHFSGKILNIFIHASPSASKINLFDIVSYIKV